MSGDVIVTVRLKPEWVRAYLGARMMPNEAIRAFSNAAIRQIERSDEVQPQLSLFDEVRG